MVERTGIATQIPTEIIAEASCKPGKAYDCSDCAPIHLVMSKDGERVIGQEVRYPSASSIKKSINPGAEILCPRLARMAQTIRNLNRPTEVKEALIEQACQEILL